MHKRQPAVVLCCLPILLLGCSREISGPDLDPVLRQPKAQFSYTLSSYFPPSEALGGWRVGTSAAEVSSLGMDSAAIAGLGAYTMSLPYETYYTGVSGYNASNKAMLVIKDGWIVGEYYNQASARTAVYYLASNGKTVAMMLVGRLMLDYPELNLNGSSLLYDPRWLPEGFPLTDERKADITFDQVFRHTSGIIPEIQEYVASKAIINDPNWNFAPFTIGRDPDFPQSAPLYYDPGNPSSYTKGSAYSSVAFNHFSLIFRNVTGVEAGSYLRRALLDRIGVGRFAHTTVSGMGDYAWATAGNSLASSRDYARLAYLLLHEGTWEGDQIFTSSWIQQFTTVYGYPNISSNAACRWGTQYPKDLYRIIGSGVNIGFIVPSLDLIATFNGRTPNKLRDEVVRVFLQKLFAGVTQTYTSCDGRIITPAPPLEPPPAITLQVTGRSDPTRQYVTSTWTGARSATVDMYRNGYFRKNTPNDGKQADSKLYTGPATYIYKICEAGTYICSNPASVSFNGGLLPPNRAPIPAFTASCLGTACRLADGSVDLDGTLTQWRWSFGDGTNSTEQSPAHTYPAPGTYSASLRITDNRGASRSITRELTVTATAVVTSR
jgi:CubicO group peptidase (beta-lactamase class C family)